MESDVWCPCIQQCPSFGCVHHQENYSWHLSSLLRNHTTDEDNRKLGTISYYDLTKGWCRHTRWQNMPIGAYWTRHGYFLQDSCHMCSGWLHSIKILMFPVLNSYRKLQSNYWACTWRSKCKLSNRTWPLNLYGINSGIRNFICRQISEKVTCYMHVIPAVVVCKH